MNDEENNWVLDTEGDHEVNNSKQNIKSHTPSRPKKTPYISDKVVMNHVREVKTFEISQLESFIHSIFLFQFMSTHDFINFDYLTDYLMENFVIFKKKKRIDLKRSIIKGKSYE